MNQFLRLLKNIGPPSYPKPDLQTTTIRRLLNILADDLKREISVSDGESSLFLMVVHDWLAHICNIPELLRNYDSSLYDVISKRTLNNNKLRDSWARRIYLSDPTMASLLYRHNICQSAMDEHLSGTYHWAILDILISSMLYNKVEFSEIETNDVFLHMDSDAVVNTLRSRKSKIRIVFVNIANREDVNDHRLIIDHAALSSYTLLLALHITKAAIQYIARMELNASHVDYIHLDDVLSAVLNEIQGVLTHA